MYRHYDNHLCDGSAIIQKWSENGQWPAVIARQHMFKNNYMNQIDDNVTIRSGNFVN